jgi:hypothetical protein
VTNEQKDENDERNRQQISQENVLDRHN